MRLRLGTRASLLAMAQSRLVAAELERLHTHLKVELVAIEARGDRDLKTPLHQVKDADFFNAELDAALIGGRIDLCVHSYKDLPSQRPPEIKLAALPKREDPRDAVLFHPRSVAKLRRGQPLMIGSSSARRHRHIADFLSWALPQQSSPPRLKFVDLRGPVDRRLDQLFRTRNDGQVLDGAVLALAGLNRLFNDTQGHQAIADKLHALRWVVVPLSACPTASGQGALAIECRDDDASTAALLAPLDHGPTREALAEEAQLLGPSPTAETAVTVVPHKQFHLLRYRRGPEGPMIQPRGPSTKRTVFDATQLAAYYHRQPLPLPASLARAKAIYVAHHRCITLQTHTWPTGPRVWVSGTTTWRHLAARNIWVEGCSDHLGFDTFGQTLACRVLALPPLPEWTAITYQDAVESWNNSGIGRVIPAYSHRPQPLPAELIEVVLGARSFFWSSPQQYQRLRQFVSADADHAAGPGKTAQRLRDMGVDRVNLFPSRQVWQQWVG
jgi:hydroxymethylbilane synthase